MTRTQAHAGLWTAGRTAWRLWPSQRRVYDAVRSRWGQGPEALLCHRDFGKSTLLITIADEEARRTANTPCAIVTDTKDHAQKIADQRMNEYLETCPMALRPFNRESKYVWRYPNGSVLWLFGADDHKHVKTMRGLGFRFVGVDEAGHIEGSRRVTLGVIVRSILGPAVRKFQRTRPDRPGQIVLATTSPMDEAHDFWTLWDEYVKEGRSHFMPLEANPDFDLAWKAARAKDAGGLESIDYKREYKCERITNADAVPVPLTEARLNGSDGKPALVQPVGPPAGDREWTVAMDVGGRHLTALLWAYYEPSTNSVRVMREMAGVNMTTRELATDIRVLEADLWTGRYPEYLERYADNNNVILLHDLDVDYRLRFLPTLKDDKPAQLGILRREIAEGRIHIDPRCVRLLATLRLARWRPSDYGRPQWEYRPEIGHADLLDALIYLVRNVRRRAYPKALPSVIEHVPGLPASWAEPPLRTRGMRELRQTLREEGYPA